MLFGIWIAVSVDIIIIGSWVPKAKVGSTPGHCNIVACAKVTQQSRTTQWFKISCKLWNLEDIHVQ